VKLCYIYHSGPVFFETVYILNFFLLHSLPFSELSLEVLPQSWLTDHCYDTVGWVV